MQRGAFPSSDPGIHLLVIRNSRSRLEPLIQELQQVGFVLKEFVDPKQGVHAAIEGGFDLVLIERSLDCSSGLDIVQDIRHQSAIPLILLTEHSDDTERTLCLELGADDILEPPGSRELAARIRAILRRAPTQRDTLHLAAFLQAGPLQLWPQQRRAHWHGCELTLTSTEFSLLEILVRQQGQPVSKHHLSIAILSRPYQRQDRTIDMHVSNLRQKLGQLDRDSTWIQTIHGVGYLWSQH